MRRLLLFALVMLAGCGPAEPPAAPLLLTHEQGERPAEWRPFELARAGVRLAPPRGVPPYVEPVPEEARLLDTLAATLENPAQAVQLRAWRSEWYPDVPVADAAGIRRDLEERGMVRDGEPRLARLREGVAVAYRLLAISERPEVRRAAQVVVHQSSPTIAELQIRETAERD